MPQANIRGLRGSPFRNPLTGTTNFSTPYRAGGSATVGGALGSPAPGRLSSKRYSKAPTEPDLYRPRPVAGLSEFKPSPSYTSPVTAARAYLRKIGEGAEGDLSELPEPITSLAPREPSTYQGFILEGERRFRNGEYIGAFNQFKLANDIGAKDAESFLSMLHARFAVSRYSYSQAAYYLQQALKFQPELPVTALHPAGFYGNAAHYVDHVFRLNQYLKTSPRDAEAYLVLAYYRWFDPSVPADRTRDALARALGLRRAEFGETVPKDDLFIEAVEVFWRGMVASGRVSGELKPIVQAEANAEPPPDESGPAEPAEKPPD